MGFFIAIYSDKTIILISLKKGQESWRQEVECRMGKCTIPYLYISVSLQQFQIQIFAL